MCVVCLSRGNYVTQEFSQIAPTPAPSTLPLHRQEKFACLGLRTWQVEKEKKELPRSCPSVLRKESRDHSAVKSGLILLTVATPCRGEDGLV